MVCIYWLTKNIDPAKLNMTIASAILAPLNDKFLNRYNGIIGSSVRDSMKAKIASSAKAMATRRHALRRGRR